MNSIRDIRREKAKFAFDSIEKVIGKSEITIAAKFKSHVKNLPMYIYKNGLIATCAFVAKKSVGKGNEDKSYKLIGDILKQYINDNYDKLKSGCMIDMIKGLIKCDPKEYRRITIDVLSMLEWLVRFSDAMIEDEGEQNEQG